MSPIGVTRLRIGPRPSRGGTGTATSCRGRRRRGVRGPAPGPIAAMAPSCRVNGSVDRGISARVAVEFAQQDGELVLLLLGQHAERARRDLAADLHDLGHRILAL